MRRLSVIVIMTLSSVISMETDRNNQQKQTYWWLGLPSPFGGRNYNLEEIQRGEHISNSSRFSKVGGGQRSFQKFNKRQIDETDLSDELNVIDINDIDTQCPRLSNCIPKFFCEKFRGFDVIDQIPCLLQSGEFAGEFGICCQEEYPRKCPDVPRLPPPEQCQPRPLGQPEDDECNDIGVKDSCFGSKSLCCFNGCLNVCLRDPPYSVQKAFFLRQMAIIVNPGEEANTDINPNDYESDSPESFDINDDDYTDFLNPRNGPPRDRELRILNEESSDKRSNRRTHLLHWLLDKLRDRIS